jgi:hypothetical protein
MLLDLFMIHSVVLIKTFFMKTRNKRPRVETIAFDLMINGRTYSVNVTPFTIATGDWLYRISYNNSPVHVFGWDEGLDRYAETDMMADVIPPVIEIAIADRLSQYADQLQHAA